MSGAFINNKQSRDLMKQLDIFFESKIDFPRMVVGNKQAIETLINEEALLLTNFLRIDRRTWIPKITQE